MQNGFLFGSRPEALSPMSGRNWKRTQPRDWQDAQDLCLRFAKEKHNRSVDSVASLMGEMNKWTLYKQIESGGLPLRLIKPFEHACGIDFVSRWLVISNGKMVLDIPRGRKCDAQDINTLQTALNDTVGALLKFYADQQDADATLAAIQTALECMAWHKGNVEKYQQPELPFDED
jgi:hypothetical protein